MGYRPGVVRGAGCGLFEQLRQHLGDVALRQLLEHLPRAGAKEEPGSTDAERLCGDVERERECLAKVRRLEVAQEGRHLLGVALVDRLEGNARRKAVRHQAHGVDGARAAELWHHQRWLKLGRRQPGVGLDAADEVGGGRVQVRNLWAERGEG